MDLSTNKLTENIYGKNGDGFQPDSNNDSISCNTIFVGPIPIEMHEDEVKLLFEEYGIIEKVSIIFDQKTSTSKGIVNICHKLYNYLNEGCAFITYRQYQSVENAVSCTHNNLSLNNVLILI